MKKWQKNFHVWFRQETVSIATRKFETDEYGWLKETQGRDYEFPLAKGYFILDNLSRYARQKRHNAEVIPYTDGYTVVFRGGIQ